MPLLFLSQHPSSLRVSFIISQASMGQFQNCCHGIAAQVSWEAMKLPLGVTVRILWGEFIENRAHARGRCFPCQEGASQGYQPSWEWWCCWKSFLFHEGLRMGQAASISPPLLLQRMSNSRISVPICVILLTEKEGISEWTCHILWPVAHWNGRRWQHKQHSFSNCLSDSLRKQSSSDSMKHTSISPKISWDVAKLHLWELKGKGGRTSKKFPLSAKLQVEDLPMEMLAGDALLTQSAAKEKGLYWGSSCPFSQKNTSWEGGKGPQGLYLGGRAPWESSEWSVYGRAWLPAASGGWLLVHRFWIRPDTTWRVSLIRVSFSQSFHRNPCFSKCWIEL